MESQGMTREELISVTIDHFTNLQRIKQAMTVENRELEYQLKILAAKLASFGVTVEDLAY